MAAFSTNDNESGTPPMSEVIDVSTRPQHALLSPARMISPRFPLSC